MENPYLFVAVRVHHPTHLIQHNFTSLVSSSFFLFWVLFWHLIVSLMWPAIHRSEHHRRKCSNIVYFRDVFLVLSARWKEKMSVSVSYGPWFYYYLPAIPSTRCLWDVNFKCQSISGSIWFFFLRLTHDWATEHDVTLLFISTFLFLFNVCVCCCVQFEEWHLFFSLCILYIGSAKLTGYLFETNYFCFVFKWLIFP